MAVEKITVGTLDQFRVTPGSEIIEISHDYCYKCGRLVIIDLAFTINATTAKSLDMVFVVPEGFRPIGTTFQCVVDNTNDIAINSSISPSGNVKIYRNHTTSMNSIRFHASYFTA